MNKRMMYAILLTAMLSLSACGVNTETSVSNVDESGDIVDGTDESSIIEVVLTDKNTSQPDHIIERSYAEDEVPLIEMVDQDVRNTPEFQTLNSIMQIADNDCITFEEDTGVTKIMYYQGKVFEYIAYHNDTDISENAVDSRGNDYELLTVTTSKNRLIADFKKKQYCIDETIQGTDDLIQQRLYEILDMPASFGMTLQYLGEDGVSKFRIKSSVIDDVDELPEDDTILTLKTDGTHVYMYMNDEEEPYSTISRMIMTDEDIKLTDISTFKEVTYDEMYGELDTSTEGKTFEIINEE